MGLETWDLVLALLCDLQHVISLSLWGFFYLSIKMGW